MVVWIIPFVYIIDDPYVKEMQWSHWILTKR